MKPKPAGPLMPQSENATGDAGDGVRPADDVIAQTEEVLLDAETRHQSSDDVPCAVEGADRVVAAAAGSASGDGVGWSLTYSAAATMPKSSGSGGSGGLTRPLKRPVVCPCEAFGILTGISALGPERANQVSLR